ncbi:efflux RND transporter periplasmic adaptor subunit [Siculibacillus lacustris]|uniref:Efflux RND transporter periplasmic adaptor subunit n=1 Tax=Siculibacillus lacustris TaxID=1549641 RepID=A0A4Q9VLC9_9HYPH|nr:efflux RND transporter periplasmic adaptor subunit [Siculibacillus lacustris]TBW36273.1 efflux RND transporter periplasmic adaptor subunit [Siculibacillus lacustris]
MIGLKANRAVAVVLIAAVGVWIGLGEFGRSASKPTPVRGGEATVAASRKVGITVVHTEAYRRALVVSGRTEANKAVAISARGPGIVEDLPVEKGTKVAAGTVIARLADEGRASALKQAEAFLAQRKIEYEAASRLTETGSNPRLNLTASRVAVDSAAAMLDMARVEVDKKTLVTPIAGVVDQIPIERGQAVGEGRLIATVLALDPILVVGEVSERSVGRAAVGRPAEVRLVTGETIKGRISYVSRSAAERTRTYRVEVEAINTGDRIAGGLTAEITLPSEPVPAVRLPRSVLTLSDEGVIGVRFVDAEGKVGFRAVEILDDTAEGLWLAGIADATRVIVAGQEFVKVGTPVVAEVVR